MGQAKRRGTYEERKAKGEAKAAQAEAERQEKLRVEQEQREAARRASTPVRDNAGRVVSPSGYRRERLSHSTLMAVAMLAGYTGKK